MSLQLYPVQPNDLIMPEGEGYRVRVNGRAVPLDTARVSAVPYNRRWPGHQRALDQTELVQFLSMAADEPLSFEITPPRPCGHAVVRPQSRGVAPQIDADGTIRFTMNEPSYVVLEPYGRRGALHLFVDRPEQRASRPDPADPSVIYYGAGVHDAGLIELKSGQTLFIDAGAVVYASVRATDARNIRILGRGILDNSRNKAQILFEAHAEKNDSAVNNAVRRHTIELSYCTHVEIDGITIRDSLVYNIRPIGCRDLTVRNVKIIGCWRFNSDGIDMHNCEDVLIEHCFLRTFDDSVCVKGFDCYYEGDVEKAVHAAMYRHGQAYDVFRRAVIRDCTVWNDWGKCFEIGAETRAEEICDILFEDSDVIHVTGPVLDCCNVDYADVHDVTYRNIRVELDETIPAPRLQEYDRVPYGPVESGYVPPLICARVEFHHEYSAGGTRRGRNRNLLFEDIKVRGGGAPIVDIAGYSETAQCRDVTVRGVCVDGRPLLSERDFIWRIGDHCENVVYERAK